MDVRFRGLPGELVRRARAKAGVRLPDVVTGLLRAYVEGQIDPLADGDPVATARGAAGGTARAARMTPDERSTAARAAVTARWARRDQA